MKYGLLTERQVEVIRYRKQGMTQQEIADIIHTSKANVCTIEKAAMENIQRAKETLDFLYTLDATRLCELNKGEDLLDAVKRIYDSAEETNVKVKYDTIELINRVKNIYPERFHGRFIRDDIIVYLNPEGEVYFS